MRIGVIGVGGAGSMAAWRTAAAGHEVVAFEQFGVDHDLGSSFGGSRIVRRVYPDPLYTSLMARSFELWDELQSRWPDDELIARRGGLFFGPTDHPQMSLARAALERSGVEFSELSASDVNRAYPGIRLQLGESALFESGMGYAKPSSAVRAAKSLAVSLGAVVYERTRVSRVDLQTDVRITTDTDEEFSVDRLILAGGPWMNRLLAQLRFEIPLTVTRQVYCHLETSTDRYDDPGFPVWMDCESNHYGFPRISGEQGVKIARHFQGQHVDPSSVDRIVTEGDLSGLIGYAHTRLPDLLPVPVYEKTCLYSNTPDENFVIDSLPDDSRVVIVSACSGHGFKFVPLVGEIACELAVAGRSSSDIRRFSVKRF